MFLKRQSEIVVAITVLLTAAGAIIAAFGGNIPPWYTSAKAAEDKRAAATIQAQTVDALGRLNSKMDRLQRHVDDGDCSDLSAMLEKAQDALRRNPEDQVALALVATAQRQMHQIQGCNR